MKTKQHKKGFFVPRNPHKYIGDLNNIVFRSSWEETYMQFLDNNMQVKRWGSEIISIPYIKPTTGRVHKYFPDFYVEYENRNGELLKEVIEVKPLKQIKKPTVRGKSKKTQLYESLTWAINMSKWKSAQLFCDKYGFKFKIMSERDIYK